MFQQRRAFLTAQTFPASTHNIAILISVLQWAKPFYRYLVRSKKKNKKILALSYSTATNQYWVDCCRNIVKYSISPNRLWHAGFVALHAILRAIMHRNVAYFIEIISPSSRIHGGCACSRRKRPSLASALGADPRLFSFKTIVLKCPICSESEK